MHLSALFVLLPLLTLASARTLHNREVLYGGSAPRLVARASASNLQTFTGDLGAAAGPISNSGNADRPFEVNGDTFVNFAAAAQRTCDVQFNACADKANAGAAGISVSACSDQESKCARIAVECSSGFCCCCCCCCCCGSGENLG